MCDVRAFAKVRLHIRYTDGDIKQYDYSSYVAGRASFYDQQRDARNITAACFLEDIAERKAILAFGDW